MPNFSQYVYIFFFHYLSITRTIEVWLKDNRNMRYSFVRFYVRYSMRALLALIILYSLVMLFCCMEGSDKSGMTFDDKFDLSYSNNLRKQPAKNASVFNEQRIRKRVQELAPGGKNVVLQMITNQKQYLAKVWYFLFHEYQVFVS